MFHSNSFSYTYLTRSRFSISTCLDPPLVPAKHQGCHLAFFEAGVVSQLLHKCTRRTSSPLLALIRGPQHWMHFLLGVYNNDQLAWVFCLTVSVALSTSVYSFRCSHRFSKWSRGPTLVVWWNNRFSLVVSLRVSILHLRIGKTDSTVERNCRVLVFLDSVDLQILLI